MTNNNQTGIPNEIIRNLVKSSIAKAQKSHLAYIEMSENIEFQSKTSSDAAFNQKALELAKNDAEENFKFAMKIVDVTDEGEAVRLRDEHSVAQSQEMARRVAELQKMAEAKETTTSSSRAD